MNIMPPDLSSTRARIADWLEMIALTSVSGEASVASLRTLFRRAADDRMSVKDVDPDGDDVGEPEVSDKATDEAVDRLVEELTFRAATIGGSYPFELSVSGSHGERQVLKRKPSWSTPEEGELFYTFCLLDSAIRDGLISVPAASRGFVTQIGNIFQICACVAVGGYIDANVLSFGFPRAKGDGFLPALQAVWRRYGSYSVRADMPHGFDSKLKDGGIDIIAWRPFSDGHAATFLMFVQVASGLDWKDKPVANDVKGIKQWFDGNVFEHFTPAICIPFPLWFDLEEPARDVQGKRQPYQQGILRRFMVREGVFGVIFDRGRIAGSCADALRAPRVPARNIDGLDRVAEVSQWVTSVMALLSEKRAAA